jgi:ABC-type amino acid transport substrate-binding protein
MSLDYHPEKATGISELALSTLSNGYAFMLKEENVALRDELDAQITAMKEDGTLQKLIDEHIIKVSEGGEPEAIAFEKFEGNPIKVAVTGSLPPMDYVAADGSFAGFNTAVLAEIGKRLQKNIELVQVDSIGRALALSEGTVDVVFWTRGASETLAERNRDKASLSQEELDARNAKLQETMTDEEKALTSENKTPDQETIEKIIARDMPAGTIITQPYFSDIPVLVIMK